MRDRLLPQYRGAVVLRVGKALGAGVVQDTRSLLQVVLRPRGERGLLVTVGMGRGTRAAAASRLLWCSWVDTNTCNTMVSHTCDPNHLLPLWLIVDIA